MLIEALGVLVTVSGQRLFPLRKDDTLRSMPISLLIGQQSTGFSGYLDR